MTTVNPSHPEDDPAPRGQSPATQPPAASQHEGQPLEGLVLPEEFALPEGVDLERLAAEAPSMQTDPSAETVAVSPEMLRSATKPEPLDSTAERRRPLFAAEDYPSDAQATVMLPTGKPEVVPPIARPLPAADTEPVPGAGSYGVRQSQAPDRPSKAPLASAPAKKVPAEPAPAPAMVAQAAAAPQAPSRPTWPATGAAATTPGPRSDSDVLLEGSSVIGQPASRAPWHWGGTLLTFVLLPFAWYLSHAGKARIAENLPAPGSPYTAGVDVVGLVEVCAGMAALVVALLVARKSAAGAISVGTVAVLLGLPFVVVPHMTWEYLSSLAVRLTEQSTLGANLVRFFIMDGFSGTFLLLGVAMIMVGVVAFSTRRAGRRERDILARKRG